MKVMELFRLAYQFIARDCMETYRKRTFPFQDSDVRFVLILPSHWNDKTQLFMKDSVDKVCNRDSS